ncbi:putative transcription factor B3-Domain family [Helianthus annuus]|nr:putative transcription factor B3-Domain family [Helianthus annuus]
MHLPEHDTTVTLVDESGTEFKTKYLKARHGLSGGWKGFSFAQKLLPGDILFFHLVGTCKLQVHIVRRYGIEAVEAAVCLMEMHPRVKRKRALTSGN